MSAMDGFGPATPTGRKIKCLTCGSTGYTGGRWMDAHRRGHLPCRRGCGKMLCVLRNGKARAHTRTCPKVAR